MQTIRIHGDNIVECERVLTFLSRNVEVEQRSVRFVSEAVIELQCLMKRKSKTEEIRFQFFPGFNKSGRTRWQYDVIDALKKRGSFLGETPDAIITRLSENDNRETILCALEFCSALQAGNQAWQRSGRAYSTMRAGCPYLYIVDFPKHELSSDRIPKSLRFPSAVVPYSYVNFSKTSPAFGAQAFFRSEEYNSNDQKLKRFDPSVFSDRIVGEYLEKIIFNESTTEAEERLLDNNMKMVHFFSAEANEKTKFTGADWREVYRSSEGFVDRVEQRKIPWKKRVASKSGGQHTKEILEIFSRYGVGMGASDLPLAYVRATNVRELLKQIETIDPSIYREIAKEITPEKPLILCAVKGFKPGGDDARPDRGILPMAAMLAGEKTQILTYIYGPMRKERFNEYKASPHAAMKKSGFWNVFLALSNVIIIDSPEIKNSTGYSWGTIGSSKLKSQALNRAKEPEHLSFTAVPLNPNTVHEDDVDSVLHIAFSALPEGRKFEGLCNPPGGDWSGLSLSIDGIESRWLSLPRVSKSIDGKRPDHVVQIIPESTDPFTLSIESKDRSADLESNVGPQLKSYLTYLARHKPSVTRTSGGEWSKGESLIKLLDDTLVSVAAYIAHGEDEDQVYKNSGCQILVSMNWKDNAWQVSFRNMGTPGPIYNSLKRSFADATVVEGIQIDFS